MTTAHSATPSLRSRNWFAARNLDGFMHRAYLKAEGFSEAVFDGRPVVGICNSWSELNNCNAHLRQVAEAVKRGVWSAGGFPLEFPVISLGEILMKPTTMLFRNLMAIDVEEELDHGFHSATPGIEDRSTEKSPNAKASGLDSTGPFGVRAENARILSPSLVAFRSHR